MILYTKEIPLILTQNLILLDDPAENGYIFVSKATYDQALLLWGRFEGDVNALMLFCKNDPDTWKDVPWIRPAMSWVKNNAPEPLNMLAPALKYAANLKDVKEEDINAELIYGILHSISQTCDFNAMYTTPSEIRAKVSIPTAILMSYKASWENLLAPLKVNLLSKLQEAIDAGDDVDDEEEERPRKKKKKASKRVIEEEEEDDDEDEEDEDADEDEDGDEEDEEAYYARLMAESAAEVAEAAKEKENKPTPSAPTPIAETGSSLEQQSSEAEESASVLDEFDMD